jgi:UDP-glucose 4-epimerase
MPKYLVTGGAGFIGSNIVHKLVLQDQPVRVLDNFSTGRRVNLAGIASSHLELLEGDLRDIETCRRAVRGVDFVLHLGAIPSVQRSVENPIDSNDVNINGTLNLLIAARDAGVKRLVFASSSSVYGDAPTLPKQEDMLPQPLSPYAVSKLTAEKYCQVFTLAYGLETVSLRYFNVFGPRQDPSSQYSAVIPLFIKAMLAGKSPVIYGDGLQSRDFTYISNVVEANLLATTAPNAAGQVFNVACGTRSTLLDLIGALNRILDLQIEPIFEPPRTGDVKHSQADISRAQAQLEYKVEVDFTEGLRQTVAWYDSVR